LSLRKEIKYILLDFLCFLNGFFLYKIFCIPSKEKQPFCFAGKKFFVHSKNQLQNSKNSEEKGREFLLTVENSLYSKNKIK